MLPPSRLATNSCFFIGAAASLMINPACLVHLDDYQDDGVHPCVSDGDCVSGFECVGGYCQGRGHGTTAVPICGNHAVESGETCDDGNATLTDSCPDGPAGTCRAAACGDGFKFPDFEECDFGEANSDTAPNTCRTTCIKAFCGDGVQDAGEACDDGNTSDDDGCTTLCRSASCGDGIVQSETSEQCDDGNSDENDECLSTCVRNLCGDGFILTGVEICDDGGANIGDGCADTCEIEPGFCCIGDVFCHAGDDGCDRACVADSTHSSANDCEVCESAANNTTWSYAGDGTACEDGDFCTTGDTCGGSQTCQPGSPVRCDDGDPCTIEQCNSSLGECEVASVVDGTSCSDRLFCNGEEQCSSGACAADPSTIPCTSTGQVCDERSNSCASCLLASDCDDGNSCTTDKCSHGICTHSADDSNTCTDGVSCNGLDFCSAGVCEHPGDPCGPGTCSNELSRAGICTCPRGYVAASGEVPTCVFEDECSTGLHWCGGSSGDCTAGSRFGYSCTCLNGFSSTSGDFPQCYKGGSITFDATHQTYGFMAGTMFGGGNLTSGDFYILDDMQSLWANNLGQRGLQRVISNEPLLDVSIPTTGYTRFNVPVVVSGTYVSLAREPDLQYYIVFRITAASSTGVSLDWVMVYRP